MGERRSDQPHVQVGLLGGVAIVDYNQVMTGCEVEGWRGSPAPVALGCREAL